MVSWIVLNVILVHFGMIIKSSNWWLVFSLFIFRHFFWDSISPLLDLYLSLMYHCCCPASSSAQSDLEGGCLSYLGAKQHTLLVEVWKMLCLFLWCFLQDSYLFLFGFT
jgi:hypothetical protein